MKYIHLPVTGGQLPGKNRWWKSSSQPRAQATQHTESLHTHTHTNILMNTYETCSVQKDTIFICKFWHLTFVCLIMIMPTSIRYLERICTVPNTPKMTATMWRKLARMGAHWYPKKSNTCLCNAATCEQTKSRLHAQSFNLYALHTCAQKACTNTDNVTYSSRPLSHIIADFKMSYTGFI